MTHTKEPTPTEIILHKKSRTLEVVFDTDERFVLSCEFLRVFSPSAEVRGHGIGNEKLVTGKEHVNILSIEPVGQYAIKPIFSDGHQSGIYSWKTLYDLGKNKEEKWKDYQDRVAKTK